MARNASSARSAIASPAFASAASIATSWSARAPPSESSTRSSAAELDVLVGTSLVAKGLDVPSVTLVGVVSSDVALNLPDERAAERTYQLLVQAVGRAGRGDRPGHAFLQTYQPDHPAIVAVQTGDAEAFYDAELDLRRRFGSPPFGRLVKLTVGLTDREAAEREAAGMADRLRARAIERGSTVAVVGPAPAYVPRRADRWRWNVVLRGDDPVALLDGDVRIAVVRGRRPGVAAVVGSPDDDERRIHATIRTHQEDAPMTDPTPSTANQGQARRRDVRLDSGRRRPGRRDPQVHE